ncbi:MAG TPA: Wzz/FepE/Etk N-terminal domain-containing protein [Acidobacteriaceae bacterium]|nr:Wzz/FepE/Etk N-terminal domain-containing protein [Acidobacteriaceae bacterium]
MTSASILAPPHRNETSHGAQEPVWAVRALLLWKHRRLLARVTAISLVVSLAIAFAMPKEYKSSASIMPPDQPNSGAALLAALSAHAGGLGALGTLATGMLGGRSSSALFIDMLRSATVSDALIDRFNLQHVYRSRYRVDAAKRLARRTRITEDKKSGVITIEVEDRDRVRARDLTQAYLDELNTLVTRTNTSAAHRERVFIEQRLHAVQGSLEDAELQLSRFSSSSNAIDIREQTHAMVDAGAQVEAELIVQRSTLGAMRQIYGDGNARVRQSEARIATLQQELARLTGSSSPAAADDLSGFETTSATKSSAELYPALRELPRLAVPWSDLYRRVRVQESVFELLTQQYEMARLEEARDVPAVSVIDAPGIPEKKSFPPRLLLTFVLTFLAFVAVSGFVLIRDAWSSVPSGDPRRELAAEVVPVLRRRLRAFTAPRRGVA